MRDELHPMADNSPPNSVQVDGLLSGGFKAEGQLGHLRRGPLCLKHTPHAKKTFAWLEAIQLRRLQKHAVQRTLLNDQSWVCAVQRVPALCRAHRHCIANQFVTWVNQLKRLWLGSCSFHHRVAI